MEIRGISSSTPFTGIRPAAESAPVLPSMQHPGQVTAQAVQSPAGAGRAAAGKKATDPEVTSFSQNRVQDSMPDEAVPATDLERVKEAMESIADSLASLSRSTGLEFAIDEDLGRVVVKVVDAETQEVIKQFPSEDAVALAKSFDRIGGSLHQAKA